MSKGPAPTLPYMVIYYIAEICPGILSVFLHRCSIDFMLVTSEWLNEGSEWNTLFAFNRCSAIGCWCLSCKVCLDNMPWPLQKLSRTPLFVHNWKLLGVRPGVKTGLFNIWVKGPWGDLKLNRMLSQSQRPKVNDGDGHKIVGLTLLSKHIRGSLFLGHRKIIAIDIHAGFLLLWWMVTISAPIMVTWLPRHSLINYSI